MNCVHKLLNFHQNFVSCFSETFRQFTTCLKNSRTLTKHFGVNFKSKSLYNHDKTYNAFLFNLFTGGVFCIFTVLIL